MKKMFISLLGGLILGIISSFIFMDYQKISYEVIGLGGVDERTIKDIDFEFAFNASLLVIGFTILIFVIWTYIDKKKDEKFYKNYNK
ncbi:hypothetical protein A1A1_01443 [Planococcus antarcticus DSM 14505]|uniref:Uncharacterized protein n=1 Tax=Planococcus antarcticus DSM 14505 TaxID=1185653 RepID=A0A1C7DHG8_9BACL|nr:hypothetical protein [Planococcus antarcticus]ANU10852.1 hypothetical protein BBH88_11285 [Planococcus antarcticus DSM 14505]EIM08317.1 hypothetical protein A1A1_01443 [Planococcus antarcticus DSM 14505]